MPGRQGDLATHANDRDRIAVGALQLKFRRSAWLDHESTALCDRRARHREKGDHHSNRRCCRADSYSHSDETI